MGKFLNALNLEKENHFIDKNLLIGVSYSKVNG